MPVSKTVSVPAVPAARSRERLGRRREWRRPIRRRGRPVWALARVPVAVLAAVALGSVCGCGSSSNGVASKGAKEVLATATNAAQEASSVHLLASSTAGALTSVVNVQYAGSGAQGHVSLLGLSFGVVRIGDTLYVNGNTRFYKQLGQTLGGTAGAAIAKLPSGTWIKASATSGPLAQVGSIANKSSELALILGRGTPVAKGAETSINGQKAIELKQTAKLYVGSLYIATTGKPYPLLERKTGREHGQTTFTNWDKPVTLTAPAHAVDLSQLEHRT